MKKTRAKVTKAPSQAQQNCRKAMAMVTELLQPVTEFVRIGFITEAKGKNVYPYHVATAYNWQNAVAGEYPKQYIDYSKVLFSKGKMPLAQTITARRTETGLAFEWELETEPGMRGADVLMVLAYSPKKRRAFYIIGGAMRSRKEEFLDLSNVSGPLELEIYVAFISTSRKSVGNSQYMGKFRWEGIRKLPN